MRSGCSREPARPAAPVASPGHAAVKAVPVELPLPVPERYRDLWAYAQERLVRQDRSSLREAAAALQSIVDEEEFDSLPRLFQTATLSNLGVAHVQLSSPDGERYLEEAYRRLWNREGDDARMILDALAVAATNRFERTLLDEDLDLMILRHEALLRLASLDPELRHERRHTLMSGLQERLRRGGRDERRLLELLDEALADRTPTREMRARYASMKAELLRRS